MYAERRKPPLPFVRRAEKSALPLVRREEKAGRVFQKTRPTFCLKFPE